MDTSLLDISSLEYKLMDNPGYLYLKENFPDRLLKLESILQGFLFLGKQCVFCKETCSENIKILMEHKEAIKYSDVRFFGVKATQETGELYLVKVIELLEEIKDILPTKEELTGEPYEITGVTDKGPEEQGEEIITED